MIEYDRINMGRPGEEYVKMRTPTSKTFILPDGKFNLKMGSGLFHYSDDEVHLDDIDLEPEDTGNQYRLIKVPYKLEISKGSPELIYRDSTGLELHLSLESIDGSSPNLTGVSKAHEKGHCLHFNGALGDGDLSVVFKSAGIHTEQDIRSEEGIRTLKWKISQNIAEPIVRETYRRGTDNNKQKAEINITRTALKKTGKFWEHTFEEKFTGNILQTTDKKTRKLKAVSGQISYPVKVIS